MIAGRKCNCMWNGAVLVEARCARVLERGFVRDYIGEGNASILWNQARYARLARKCVEWNLWR